MNPAPELQSTKIALQAKMIQSLTAIHQELSEQIEFIDESHIFKQVEVQKLRVISSSLEKSIYKIENSLEANSYEFKAFNYTDLIRALLFIAIFSAVAYALIQSVLF
jgi:hypothetical protein